MNPRPIQFNDLGAIGFAVFLLVLGFCLLASGLPAATPPTIIIDPGHGGQDIGAVGPSGAPREKDLTLALARKVAEVLQNEGVARVLLTRKEDQALGLDERAGVANHRGDVFVSLHVGNSFQSSALGFSLYYWSPTFRDSAPSPLPDSSAAWDYGQLPYWEQSRRLARFMERELQQRLTWASGGLVEADLYLLRRVKMPAVLLELGSLNYPPETADLVKPSFQEAVAHAIAEAVRQFGNMR